MLDTYNSKTQHRQQEVAKPFHEHELQPRMLASNLNWATTDVVASKSSTNPVAFVSSNKYKTNLLTPSFTNDNPV